jgi:hypothetical protein
MSGSLSLDALGVMFYAHPPKGVLKSHHSILPRDDSAFLAIQLPLPGEELPLQLDGQRLRGHCV